MRGKGISLFKGSTTFTTERHLGLGGIFLKEKEKENRKHTIENSFFL